MVIGDGKAKEIAVGRRYPFSDVHRITRSYWEVFREDYIYTTLLSAACQGVGCNVSILTLLLSC